MKTKCLNMAIIIPIALMIVHLFANVDAVTVNNAIREDADLSEFYNLLEQSPIANSTLMLRHVTVFAPTNRAFQDYDLKNDHSNLVLYHMSNQPQTLEELSDTISSELDGNPPLWVTRKRVNDGHEEIYINNAKILEGSNFKSNLKLPTGEHRIQ